MFQSAAAAALVRPREIAMFNDSGATIVRKPLSFLAVAAFSVGAVLMTAIVSGVGLAAYGLHVVDKKSDGIVGLIEQTARSLPEIRAALPPALADTLDDVRRPDYRDSLQVTVKETANSDRWGGRKIGVVVENRGDRMISLLSMRIVGTDDDGTPVTERSIWAASPIQIDNDWRGPLMPHESRRLVVYCRDAEHATKFSSEITEVRVWQGDKSEAANEKPAAARAKKHHDDDADGDA